MGQVGQELGWEFIDLEDAETPRKAEVFTDRLLVPGGWLYRVMYKEHFQVVFVPEVK